MLCITLRFPLGVYHARSDHSPTIPEWPPSPVRLIGALLAAAHGRRGEDPEPDRALIQRLCEAESPEIVAPRSAPFDGAGADGVAEIQGPSRWAPVNYFEPGKGRKQAGVEKVGVAIGDRPVHFVWRDVEFDGEDRERFAALAAEVSFVGTSRSPAIMTVSHEEPSISPREAWMPPAEEQVEVAMDGVLSAHVRVPDGNTIAIFDRRHASFASDRDKVEKANLVTQQAVGRPVSYQRALPDSGLDASRADVFDSQHWQDILVLAIDREHSELVPMAPAAYMFARALRVALLGAFEEEGSEGEAPAILRARGADPHCAIVPMANVGFDHSDGRVLGAAVVFPHPSRVVDLPAQRAGVETGLAELVTGHPGERRYLQIPGAGRVLLKQPQPASGLLASLDPTRYTRAAREWVTVTPVVHSRWPKAKTGGIAAEIARDCEHVGLPCPEGYEVLRGPALRGAPGRQIRGKQLPPAWRSLLQGPASHLRLRFDRPVRGPLLLGRARHFGVGVLVPAPETSRADGGGSES